MYLNKNKNKDSVQDVSDLCPVLVEERNNKNVVCEYLTKIYDFINVIDDYAQEYLINLNLLRYEIEYNLFKAIKKLDPDFPWDDPFGEEEIEDYQGDDSPRGMYEVLKKYVEQGY